MEIFHNDWKTPLAPELEQQYYRELRKFLITEYRTRQIFPDMYDIFNALHYTSLADTKVVILGQDPYHEPGQAHGLSFSVKPGVQPPPSLINIFKELSTDLGCTIPNNGCLKPWAEQGVLLLNAYLSVRAGIPLSHVRPEYDKFMDDVLKYVESLDQPIVYMLWGGFAKKYASKVTNPKHIVLSSVHPSPLSANRGGWFGQHLFSKCNAYLTESGTTPIDWQIK
jgi:uracil-DNA glycosylase